MGLTSAIGSYSRKQLQVSKMAHAISHPARIAILELLQTGDCTCNDMVNSLPLAQSTVSQHLKELQKAKLIFGTQLPPRTIYSINKPACAQIQVLLNSFFVS